MSEEKLTEVQKIIAYYGQRCALQNGNGSTTPGVDFNNAVDAIGSLINQQVIQALERAKQGSMLLYIVEPDSGYPQTYARTNATTVQVIDNLIKEYKGE